MIETDLLRTANSSCAAGFRREMKGRKTHFLIMPPKAETHGWPDSGPITLSEHNLSRSRLHQVHGAGTEINETKDQIANFLSRKQKELKFRGRGRQGLGKGFCHLSLFILFSF